MSGFEVAKAKRKLPVDVPTVLINGLSVAEVTLLPEGLGIAGFMQKSFNGADLLAAFVNGWGSKSRGSKDLASIFERIAYNTI
jgi:hypothetical protein